MVFDVICGIIGEQLGVDPDEISEDMNLFDDLDANDADMVKILSAIEEHYDLDEIPEAMYESLADLEKLVEYVQGQTGEE